MILLRTTLATSTSTSVTAPPNDIDNATQTRNKTRAGASTSTTRRAALCVVDVLKSTHVINHSENMISPLPVLCESYHYDDDNYHYMPRTKPNLHVSKPIQTTQTNNNTIVYATAGVPFINHLSPSSSQSTQSLPGT